jgi:DNA-directed RNA polymerase
MTKTYGVTAVGARQQLTPRLLEIGIPKEQAYAAASYLAGVTLDSIGDVCPAAKAIMDWLRLCARKIVTEAEQSIQWTTPLGFPVVQPYKKWREVEIRTILHRVKLALDDEGLPPFVSRQVNGIAPNFIHSLDATHMFNTAAAARQRGIAFVAVHDAFWTHAADADDLCDLTRREFVSLHSADLLTDLHTQFTARYKIDLPEPPPPQNADFNLNDVLDALYFFN